MLFGLLIEILKELAEIYPFDTAIIRLLPIYCQYDVD